MQDQEINIKAYKQEVEVLSLQMDVPVYDGKWANYFPRYEDVLLKLFNSKRENKEILAIRNYYGSNKICVEINLTEYADGTSREESIKHLIEWFIGELDLSQDMVEQHIYKGYIYNVPEWENNIETYDKTKKETIKNYIEWEY